ncbi:uncharacterized protein L3040_000041 [Drepanopeziza brunnea f. sp. 'multigermtubi']|uniref:uncharacterized protein n=1 Tax=Drepanopeziza brunnea f. sp. 'multigermtubi' TaxID=698441 RepID=UPI00239A8358|nr:hypothetical protein L3040_000041 [Drepanopeziza brunnea f. sp. 'multigermtubi']
MKAMKRVGINRVLGSIRRKTSADTSPETALDTPEANAIRNARLFCESGGPKGSAEEVLYLPMIVEACESSPSAAQEASLVIRKFLSKDNFTKPYVQYNAIILIRILADNPGRTFTRNIDAKFVATLEDLLQVGRNPSVKQLLMETLETFGREKSHDEGLALLGEMWKRERERIAKEHGPPEPRTPNVPPPGQQQQQSQQSYFSRSHSSRQLPTPHELSSRIEEARTSADLLSQVVQSTPPSEILHHELVREFADRCQSASRSIQAYMIAENPSPDNDTMEQLIETNEQLNRAMNQHQRALLSARKAASQGANGASTPPAADLHGAFAPPAGPPPGRTISRTNSTLARKPVKTNSQRSVAQVPAGPEAEKSSSAWKTANPPFPRDEPSAATGQFNDRMGVEPYHPGFSSTPSFTGRPQSSMGKVMIHTAAVPERDEPDSDDDDDGRKETVTTTAPTIPAKEPVYRF